MKKRYLSCVALTLEPPPPTVLTITEEYPFTVAEHLHSWLGFIETQKEKDPEDDLWSCDQIDFVNLDEGKADALTGAFNKTVDWNVD